MALTDVALLADRIQQLQNQRFFPVSLCVHDMNTITPLAIRSRIIDPARLFLNIDRRHGVPWRQ
jgi:hypothetical protein